MALILQKILSSKEMGPFTKDVQGACGWRVAEIRINPDIGRGVLLNNLDVQVKKNKNKTCLFLWIKANNNSEIK